MVPKNNFPKFSFLFLFLFLSIISKGIAVSQPVPFAQKEDSLKIMLRKIITPDHDFERLALNLKFKTYFEEVLNLNGSIDYPFDSLITVSRLRSPDGSFRIISWYIPLQDGKFEYFGFFQSMTSGNESIIYTLQDMAEKIQEPQFETLDHDNWYGAYYLELIHKRVRRTDHYVLLGWRGDNPLTRKRIIEPLSIMARGRPSFGKPVFRYENNRHRRIIFEYSARVSMGMRYETHTIEQGRRAQEVIIFDRMAPTHSFLRGNYQFYVPETNIFDGFYFDNGKWIFTEDIDARVPRRRPPPRPTPPAD